MLSIPLMPYLNTGMITPKYDHRRIFLGYFCPLNFLENVVETQIPLHELPDYTGLVGRQVIEVGVLNPLGTLSRLVAEEGTRMLHIHIVGASGRPQTSDVSLRGYAEAGPDGSIRIKTKWHTEQYVFQALRAN